VSLTRHSGDRRLTPHPKSTQRRTCNVLVETGGVIEHVLHVRRTGNTPAEGLVEGLLKKETIEPVRVRKSLPPAQHRLPPSLDTHREVVKGVRKVRRESRAPRRDIWPVISCHGILGSASFEGQVRRVTVRILDEAVSGGEELALKALSKTVCVKTSSAGLSTELGIHRDGRHVDDKEHREDDREEGRLGEWRGEHDASWASQTGTGGVLVSRLLSKATLKTVVVKEMKDMA
jgi:hypothetical protein